MGAAQAEALPLQGISLFAQLDPRLDNNEGTSGTLGLQSLIESLGGTIVDDLTAADYVVLQHRKQPEHEAALAAFRRVVGLGWLLATVQRGGPAPLGPRAFKPFPVSALVREGDLRLCTTGYAGKPRQLLLLMMRCTGAEVTREMRPRTAADSVLLARDFEEDSLKIKHARSLPDKIDMLNALWVLDSLVAGKLLPRDRYRGQGEILQALQELAEEAAAGMGGDEAAGQPAVAAGEADDAVVPDSQGEGDGEAGTAAAGPAAAPASADTQQPIIPETASAGGAGDARLALGPSPQLLPAVTEEAAGQGSEGAAVPQQDGSGEESPSQQAQMQLAGQRAALAAAAQQEVEAAVAATAAPPTDNSGPLLPGGRRFGATQAMAAVGGLVADLGTAEDLVFLPGGGSEAAGEEAEAAGERRAAPAREQPPGDTTSAELYYSTQDGQPARRATSTPTFYTAAAQPAGGAGAAAAGGATAQAAPEQGTLDEGEETPDELDADLAAAGQQAVGAGSAAAAAAWSGRREQAQQAVPLLQATEALDSPGDAPLEGSETEADEDLPPLQHLLHQGSRPASAAGTAEADAEPPGGAEAAVVAAAAAAAAEAAAEERSPVSTEEVGQASDEDVGAGSGSKPTASDVTPTGGAGARWRQVRRSVTSDIGGSRRSDDGLADAGAAADARGAEAVPAAEERSEVQSVMEGDETEDEGGEAYAEAAKELEPAAAAEELEPAAAAEELESAAAAGELEPAAAAEVQAELPAEARAEPAAAVAPAPAAPTLAAAPAAAPAQHRDSSPPVPPPGKPGSPEVARRAVTRSRSRSRSATPSGNGSGRKRKQPAPERAMFSQQLPEADEHEQHSLQAMKESELKAAAKSSGRKPAAAAATARAKAKRAKRSSDGVETALPLKRKGSRLGLQRQQQQVQEAAPGVPGGDTEMADAPEAGQRQALPDAAAEAASPGPARKRSRQSAKSKAAAAAAAAEAASPPAAAAAQPPGALAAEEQQPAARGRRQETGKQKARQEAQGLPAVEAAEEEQPAADVSPQPAPPAAEEPPVKSRRGRRPAQQPAEAAAQEAPDEEPEAQPEEAKPMAGRRSHKGRTAAAAAAANGKPEQPPESPEQQQQKQAPASGRRGRSAAAAAAEEAEDQSAPQLPAASKRGAARRGRAAAASGKSPQQQAAPAPAAEEEPAEAAAAARGRRSSGRRGAAPAPPAAAAEQAEGSDEQPGQPARGRRAAAKGTSKQQRLREPAAEQAGNKATKAEDGGAPAATAAGAVKRKRAVSAATGKAKQHQQGEEAARDEAASGPAKRRRALAGSAGKAAAEPAGKVATVAAGEHNARGRRSATPAAAGAAAGQQQGRGRRSTTATPAAPRGESGPPSSEGRKVVVALSGMHSDEQRRLAAKLRKIKVECLTGSKDSHHWSPGISHVVASAPRRNQKCLAMMAAGGWLVSPDWVEASAAAGRLVDEGPYELSQAQPELEGGAAPHWRRRRAATGAPAFQGLRCHVAAALDAPFKRADIVNVLKAGGATLLSSASRPDCDLAVVPSWDAARESGLRELAAAGVLVAGPRYVVDWVAQPSASLAEHVLLRSKPGLALAAAAAARSTMAAPAAAKPGRGGGSGEASEEEEAASQASVLFD